MACCAATILAHFSRHRPCAWCLSPSHPKARLTADSSGRSGSSRELSPYSKGIVRGTVRNQQRRMARGYKFGCVCSYMAGHCPGILVTGHVGTNTPQFVPLRWGRPPLDPTQMGLCKFGWVWSSLTLALIADFGFKRAFVPPLRPPSYTTTSSSCFVFSGSARGPFMLGPGSLTHLEIEDPHHPIFETETFLVLAPWRVRWHETHNCTRMRRHSK